MLVGVAFVPGAPVLVPRVSEGAADELADIRTACRTAIHSLVALGPELVVAVAPGDPTEWPDCPPTFARIGLADPPADTRPLGLHVGCWMLENAGWTGPTRWVSTAGGELAMDSTQRVGVLAIADGSARRSAAAPGYIHPDADEYDGAVALALAGADAQALLDLDPQDDERLLVNGRPVWQSVARAARSEGPRWRGELLMAEAPYGVGYFVAGWRRG